MNDLSNGSACNLCNHNEFQLVGEVPRLERRIVRCKKCGLVFVDPMNESFLTLDFENRQQRELKYHSMRRVAENAGKHDEHVINREETVRTLHFKSRRDKIERYVNSGRLLDVGCGRGFFLLNFVGSHMDFFGVEPRKRISQEAQKRLGEDKVFCGTLKEAKFPDAYFDAVTLINLIEHLPCPRETLEEANRVMKNDGLLLIETPNVASFLPTILMTKWHAFLEPEHHYFFSKDTLTAMLKNTGFRVLRMSRGNKLFSIRYLLYRLSWYNKKIPLYLEKVLDGSGLLEKTVNIPQFDELIIIAKKIGGPARNHKTR
jgi:ubiquinone/menaquinone biosynthesis C-methylase UbiE